MILIRMIAHVFVNGSSGVANEEGQGMPTCLCQVPDGGDEWQTLDKLCRITMSSCQHKTPLQDFDRLIDH